MLERDVAFSSQTMALGCRREPAQAQLLSGSVYDFHLPEPCVSVLCTLSTQSSGLLMAHMTGQPRP